jgi:TPR repeat protein
MRSITRIVRFAPVLSMCLFWLPVYAAMAQPATQPAVSSTQRADPRTATDTPDVLSGFTQNTRTLSRAFLDRVNENESICWGRMDESNYYGIVDALKADVTKDAAAFATANSMPLWRCVNRIPLILGKIDFITKPENRRARLIFVETTSQKRHEIQLLSGVADNSLFYIVLPRGTYRMAVNQRWGDNNAEFDASANRELVVTGGRNAVHIGHLRMGIDRNQRGQPGLVVMLFDTANAEAAEAWFKSAHPSFKGALATQRLVQQPAVTDAQGRLYAWHKNPRPGTAPAAKMDNRTDAGSAEIVASLRKAAAGGDAQAMLKLAICYETGLGVKQDRDEAMGWHRKAADAGNKVAMNHLGVLYTTGTGAAQNYGEAMKWFRKAADASSADAMNNIGMLYDRGNGVERDPNEAMRWWTRAAEAGNEIAKRKLRELGSDDTNGSGASHRTAPDLGNQISPRMGSAPDGEIPEAARKHYNEGNDAFAKGDLRAAVASFTRALESFPSFAEAYDNRGIARRRIGQFEEAVADHSKAIAIKPAMAEAYHNRAEALIKLNRYKDAMADLDHVIETAPKTAAVSYNTRGGLRADKKQYPEAVADFTKAVEIKPDYWEADYNRAWVSADFLNNHEAAVRDYSKALDLNPDLLRAYNNRAVSFYFLKRYDEAWRDVAECRRRGLNPNQKFVDALTQASGK